MTIRFIKGLCLIMLVFLMVKPLFPFSPQDTALGVTVHEPYIIDCDYFYFTVCVRDSAGYFVRELSIDDFDIQENGEAVVPPALEMLSDCPAESSKVDIVMLMDMSSSMDDDLARLAVQVPRFVMGLTGTDYRISIIRFNGCSSTDRVIIRTDFSLSTCRYISTGPDMWATTEGDFSCLYDAAMTVSHGSGHEDQYGAMVFAAENLTFRTGASVYFILLTDERPQTSYGCSPYLDESRGSYEWIRDYLNSHNIHCIPVTPNDGEFEYWWSGGESPDRRFYDWYYDLGPETGGAWFYLYSDDYGELVDDITGTIVSTPCCYHFRYPLVNFCTEANTLYVSVDGYGEAETTYIPPCPPVLSVLVPPFPGGVTTCRNQPAVFLFDRGGVDTNTIILSVDDSLISISSSGGDITFYQDTLRYIPSVSFAHNETVRVALFSASDTFGCPIDAVSTVFVVDTLPPEFLSPAPTGVVHTATPDISVRIVDAPAGVDPATVTLENTEVSVNSSPVAGYSISWDGEILHFLGLEFSDRDTVRICVSDIADDPDYLFCPANVADEFCWSFFVSLLGPVARNIIPLDSTYTACDDQWIKIVISDPDGISPETVLLEVAGREYSFSSPEVDFSGDTLVFTPTTFFTDAETVAVRLIHIEDIYGNPNADTLTFLFIVDLTPPEIAYIEPAVPMVRDESPRVLFEIYDALSGVNLDSIRFELNGRQFSPAQLIFTPVSHNRFIVLFDPTALGLEFSEGDTLTFTLYSCDSPDYCPPNCSSISGHFMIEPTVSCLVFPNPFSPNGDGYNDVAVFNYQFMFSETAKIRVFNLRGVLVWEKDVEPLRSIHDYDARSWDGQDLKGNPLPEGLYPFTIEVKGQLVCQGTVTLAR